MQESIPSDGNSIQSKEPLPRKVQIASNSKVDSGNSSSVHPVRSYEDENLDYDSTSSFEFHKGERSLHHSLTRSFSRPMSSKWNDAEKWIMNRQNGPQNNIAKKSNLQNRQMVTNMGRVMPEAGSSENKLAVKKVDFCQPGSNMGKFGYTSNGAAQVFGRGNGGNATLDSCPESKDLKEVDDTGLPCTKSVTEENTGNLVFSDIVLIFLAISH